METSTETDATTLAAEHPYGHEEISEISRSDFDAIIRDGSYVEEDTFEDLPTEEVVEGVNRELDLMKSLPVNQAVPRAEVTGKVWPTRWCHRRMGPSQDRARSVVSPPLREPNLHQLWTSRQNWMQGHLLQYIRTVMTNLQKPAGQSLNRSSKMAPTLRENTFEDFPSEEVVEVVNRELDPMKSFLVYQAVPRAEVTCQVWSTRWCYRSKGPKQGSETFRNNPGRSLLQSHSWTRRHKSFAGHGSVEGPHQFVL